MYEIILGKTYRDSVTEFTGIAVSHCRHLTGPDRIGLDSKVNERGETYSQWFDIQRLEPVEG